VETTVQVIDIMIFGFGFIIGLWSGVIKERDRQNRRRRQVLAARLRRSS
jgi:hypothetical protein